jgi:hypothetical protein
VLLCEADRLAVAYQVDARITHVAGQQLCGAVWGVDQQRVDGCGATLAATDAALTCRGNRGEGVGWIGWDGVGRDHTL